MGRLMDGLEKNVESRGWILKNFSSAILIK